MDKKQIAIEISERDLVITPKVELYSVKDFLGKELPGLAIVLADADDQSYNTLTVSFGEFIGVKNCAYVDTNNNDPEIIQAFVDAGYAKDTGFTKHSGFCVYPLYCFNEDFLKSAGGKKYDEYSAAYDKYFADIE